VAGEASADLSGARLLAALRRGGPGLEAFGVGGAALRAAGLACCADAAELELVGFTGLAARLPALLRIERRLASLLREARPDVLVCIDLPDFNARLAGRARAQGIPVLFYVAPQIWAWRPGRAARWRGRVSRLVVTLPFELPLWERAGVPAAFHGHPLLEGLEPRFATREAALHALGLDPARRVVVLAPGSRESEWHRHGSLLFRAAARLAREFGDLAFAVPLAPRARAAHFAREAARAGVEIACTPAPHQDLLRHAELGLLCSGTLTLEAALAELPLVAFYRVGRIDALLARALLRSDRVALPNVLLGGPRPVFPELLQQRATPARLAAEAAALLRDPAARAGLRAAGRRVREILTAGAHGATSEAIAEEILKLAAAGRAAAAACATPSGSELPKTR
jgi:lipid-A-disaccharide synthase